MPPPLRCSKRLQKPYNRYPDEPSEGTRRSARVESNATNANRAPRPRREAKSTIQLQKACDIDGRMVIHMDPRELPALPDGMDAHTGNAREKAELRKLLAEQHSEQTHLKAAVQQRVTKVAPMIDEIKESPPNWESPTPPTPLMYTPPGPDELLSSPRPDESPPSQRCPNCAHHHSAFERQSELLPGGAIKLTTDVLARMGGALSPASLPCGRWIRITHKEVDAPIDGLGKDEILSDWFESSESGSSPKEHEPDLDASLMLERQIRTIAVQPAGLMSTKELCTPVVQLSSPQDKLFRGCDSAAGQIQSLMRPSGRWLLAGAGTLLLFALSALSLSALGCAGLSCALTRMGEHEVMAPVSMLDESNTMLDSMFESPLHRVVWGEGSMEDLTFIHPTRQRRPNNRFQVFQQNGTSTTSRSMRHERQQGQQTAKLVQRNATTSTRHAEMPRAGTGLAPQPILKDLARVSSMLQARKSSVGVGSIFDSAAAAPKVAKETATQAGFGPSNHEHLLSKRRSSPIFDALAHRARPLTQLDEKKYRSSTQKMTNWEDMHDVFDQTDAAVPSSSKQSSTSA